MISWEGSDYENNFRFYQHPLKAVQQVAAVRKGTGVVGRGVHVRSNNDSEDTYLTILLCSSQVKLQIFPQLFFLQIGC